MDQKVICIIAADFNKSLIDPMIEVASSVLRERPDYRIRILRVPGAFEVPIVADAQASQADVCGLIVLAYIERGETLHGEVMGHVVHSKLVDIQLKYKKPMGLGIIGPGATIEQATARHREYAQSASRALFRILDLFKAD